MISIQKYFQTTSLCRRLIVITLFLCSFLLSYSQETLILKDGTKIKCYITKTDSLNIYFDMIKDRQEVHTYVDKNDVMSIHYNKSSFDTLSRRRSLPLNSVYFELFGSSYYSLGVSFCSLDYERVILHIRSFYMDGRIGGFYMSMYQGGNDPLSKILHLNCLINFQYQFANCFSGELGIGYNSLLGSNNDKSEDYYNCMIGIKYTGKRGFMMRISYVPFWGEYDEINYNNGNPEYKLVVRPARIPGFTIGYSFGKHKPKKY